MAAAIASDQKKQATLQMADIKICISLVAYSLICLCACVLCFFVFILYAYLFFSIEAPRNGCSHCIGPKKKQATLQMADICLNHPKFPIQVESEELV